MKHYSKSKGFTLVELTIVIVVVGILITYVVLMWPDKSIELDTQAAQLASDIRYVQSLSMSHNNNTATNNLYLYRLDLSNSNQYQILDGSGNPIKYPPGSSTTIVSLGNGISMSNNRTSYLVFDGTGTPYYSQTASGTGNKATQNMTITLSSPGVSNVRLRVYRYTGLVEKI